MPNKILKKANRNKILLAFIVAMLAGVSGCSGDAGQNISRDNEQMTPTVEVTVTSMFAESLAEDKPLRILLVQHPTSDIIQKYIGEFEEQTGSEVELEVTSFYDAHQKQLLDFGAGNSQYDVMMVVDTWLPEFVMSDNILELRRQVRSLEQEGNYQWLADIIPNVNLLLGQWQGKQVAVPLMASSLVLMYRRDLFEDPEIQNTFFAEHGRQLAVPETWEDFNETARFFTRSLNPESPTDYGVSVAALSGNSALCLFQTVLWGMDGREFAKRWRVTLNNEAGIKAMELWSEWSQYAPPDAPNMYWHEMNRVFEEGRAAMQIQWDAFALELETSSRSKVQKKVGYALVPGEPEPVPVIGGWVLVVNKNSELVPLAWEFIKWAGGPDLGYTINWEGGQVPRLSLYTDPSLMEKFPYYETSLLSLEMAQQRTSFAPGGPTLPAQGQYEKIVGSAAHDAFTGLKSPQEAIDDAAEELGAMLTKIGWR